MKQKLKIKTIEKRNSLTEEEVLEKSEKIINNLKSLSEFQKAKNILFYVSFNKEVNTQKLIKELLGNKEKNIIVPYVKKNNPNLFLSEIKDFIELEPKTHGILEPKEKYIREFDRDKLELIIVPGIVFNGDCFRIGYGFGFYDRFLKTIKKDIIKIGLAFDLQVVEQIPIEKHDVCLNIVITEKEIIRCN